MSTSELERRLGEVLRQHAEDAMDSTDTQTRLETLERDLGSHRPRIRIGWVAAAAAAVVVAALVVVDIRGGDDRSGTPAGPVDEQAAEAVASEFLAAVAAYDADRAAPYLADGARVALWPSAPGIDVLGQELRWTQAAGVRLIPGRCEHEGVSGRASTVVCAFDFHALGSQRLERGPFSDNAFRFGVVDGEVVSGEVDPDLEAEAFGRTMWDPFTAWLLSNRADEAALMFADWPGWPLMRPALSERSAKLWTKNVAAYVRAVKRGDAF